jgi:NADPH2:quinone reductase
LHPDILSGLGASVISTVSRNAKAKLAKAAGAHHIFDYGESGAAAQIRDVAPVLVTVDAA